MRKKGFLLKNLQGNDSRIPIWIIADNPNYIFPITYEYRNVKGYKGILFTAKKNEVEYEKCVAEVVGRNNYLDTEDNDYQIK